MTVYVVQNIHNEVVAVYEKEGHARRFCKDNGYSHSEWDVFK